MENKTARLTLLIDPNKKAAFERLCEQQDRTASQVVRQLIRDYLAKHGVTYTAAGTEDEPEQPSKPVRTAATKAGPKSRSSAAAAAKTRPGPRATARRR